MDYKVKNLDGLSEDVAKMYKKDGEGFILAISGLPDYGKQETRIEKMDAKIDDLLTEKKKAKTEAEEAKAAADKATHDAAQKGGDIDALNASWQKKYDDLGAEHETLLTSRDGTINKLTSGSAATTIASELALKGSSDVLLPHISKRLKTDIVDGVAKTVVLDADGKPSAQTLDELKTEFQNNAAFAPLIVGSSAGGSGTGGENNGGGAAGKVISRTEFDGMGAGQRMSFLKDGGSLTDSTH